MSNTARFTNNTQVTYGICNGSTYYIIPAFLRAALEEVGFDYSKVIRGFKTEGISPHVRMRKGTPGCSIKKESMENRAKSLRFNWIRVRKMQFRSS